MAKRSALARPAELYAAGFVAAGIAICAPCGALPGGLEFTMSPSPRPRLRSSGSTALAALDPYALDRADDPTSPWPGTRPLHVEAAMDDDLAIAPAPAALFDLVRDLNRGIAHRTMSTADAAARRRDRDLDHVLGVMAADDAAAAFGRRGRGDPRGV